MTDVRCNKANGSEEILKFFYQVMEDVVEIPETGVKFAKALKSLTESFHPVGVRDVRTIEFSKDIKLNIDMGDRLGCYYYYGFCPEKTDTELFLNLLRNEGVMLDVGSNFGSYAIRCGKRYPDLQIHAFEPAPTAYELLSENVKINNLKDSIICHKKAVSSESGKSSFYESEESSFSGLGDSGRAGIRSVIDVDVVSLDDFADDKRLGKVNAIKIDVEGFEYEVFCGATELLERSDDFFMMFEYHKKNLSDEKHRDLMTKFESLLEKGVQLYVVMSDSEFRNLKGADALADLGSVNLFLFSSRFAEERDIEGVFRKTVADMREVKTAGGSGDSVKSFLVDILTENSVLISKLKNILQVKEEKFVIASDRRNRFIRELMDYRKKSMHKE